MVTDNEKQAFSKRLNAILDKAGVPPKGKGRQLELGKMFGVSDKGARKWIEAEAIPAMTKLTEIVARFKDTGVTIEWLLTGNDAYSPNQTFEIAPRLAIAKRIPIVGTAKLGDNGYFVELETPTGFGDGFIEHATRDENAYAVRCVGDSMKPRIRNGEFVIVSPNQQPISGDDVLIRDKSGRVMVKTLLYIRDDKVHLLSINEAHPPQYIELSQVEIMHYVTAIAPKTAFIRE